MYYELLREHFGITPLDVFEVKGGWSAKAYRVNLKDETYFLKVYDKSLPTIKPWIERIDDYIPVLGWLSEKPELHERLIKPIKTLNGKYKVETDESVLLLFVYIPELVPNKEGLSRSQLAELAETMALLHTTGKDISFDTQGLTEDISLPFCKQLEEFLNNMGDDTNAPMNNALITLISPHADMLRAAIQKTVHLRDTIRLNYSPLVLCHGDAHSNNVIQGERLVLVDWEDLRWAPAEADLFIYAWHPNGHALLEAYSATRGDYRINQELLNFYILRRRIEDLWVDVQRLTEESPGEAETATLLDYTRLAIEGVKAVYSAKR